LSCVDELVRWDWKNIRQFAIYDVAIIHGEKQKTPEAI
jgi:hypothetical protein